MRLAFGHRRAHGKVCKGRKGVIHNSEKVGLWEGGPRLSGVCGVRRGAAAAGRAGRPGRTGVVVRAAAFCSRPEVGVCPAAFCAGSSRSPSRAAAAAEGQEQGPGASGRGRESARAAAG